jgi:hypothetical protein
MNPLALMFLKSNWKALLGGLFLLVLLGTITYQRHELTETREELSVVSSEAAQLKRDLTISKLQLKTLADESDVLKKDLVVAQEKSQQVRVVTETKVQKILVKGLPAVPADCVTKTQPVADAAVDSLNDIWKGRK